MVERVFFALWPPPDVARAIAARAARVGLDGRVIPADRLHMTLAFYGRRDPLGIARLVDIADRIAVPAFDLNLDLMSHFRRAGVTWLGPAVPPAPLVTLATGLMAAVAFGPRSVSQPHVSVRRDSDPLMPAPITAIKWPVSEFALTASGRDGTPGGYRDLVRWRLGARAVPPVRI